MDLEIEIKMLYDEIIKPYLSDKKIDIPDDLLDEYKSSIYHNKLGNSPSAKGLFMKDIKLKSDNGKRLIFVLNELYNIEGRGIKLIAKYCDESYTKTRSLFRITKVPMRKGRSVCTDYTKEERRLRAYKLLSEGRGAFSTESQLKAKNNSKIYLQGKYYNKSMNKYVWLRSSYEYIFAKWLDKTNQIWDTEVTRYEIKYENEIIRYTPDFFIYEENILKKIVEIKGFWKNRAYKVPILSVELEKKNIDVSIIYNVKLFIDENSSLDKEREEWKNLIKSQK